MSEQVFLDRRIPVRAKELKRAKDKPVAMAMNASFGIGDASVILSSLDDCVELFIQSPGSKGLSFSSEWKSRIGFYSGEKDKNAELALECTVRKVSLLKKETKKEGDLVVLRFHVVADEIEGNRDSESAREARKFLDEMARLGLPWYLAFSEGKDTQQVIPGTPKARKGGKSAIDRPAKNGPAPQEDLPAAAPEPEQSDPPAGKKSAPANPGDDGRATATLIDKAMKLAKKGPFQPDDLTASGTVRDKTLKRLVDAGKLVKVRRRVDGSKVTLYELAEEGSTPDEAA